MKDFLICVDSDGCVMDTMNIKHEQCFGPQVVKVFLLEDHKEEVLKRWNEINLYSMTRGINRFKGLALILQEADRKYRAIEGLDEYLLWVKQASILSNQSLTKAICAGGGPCLVKALEWSKYVNEEAGKLPKMNNIPYKMAEAGLITAHYHCDVAVVSSANLEAVEEEWSRNGLMPYVDTIFAQNAGTKAHCIGKLLKKGYKKEQVLMIGDAPGDLEAAKKNGVAFYPILVGMENQSWQEFMKKGIHMLVCNQYLGAYQDQKIKEFMDQLRDRG